MDANEQKYAIVSRLINKEEPQQIAEELDLPKTKVMRINREYKAALENNELEKFIDMDKLMMKELLVSAQEQQPTELQELAAQEIEKITSTKNLLDAFSGELIATASLLTKQIKLNASRLEHTSDLDMLVDSLCKLQNAFFNQNKTQVNVQNNYGGGEQSGGATYGEFLSDKPKNY